jgi:hypothetical protein
MNITHHNNSSPLYRTTTINRNLNYLQHNCNQVNTSNYIKYHMNYTFIHHHLHHNLHHMNIMNIAKPQQQHQHQPQLLSPVYQSEPQQLSQSLLLSMYQPPQPLQQEELLQPYEVCRSQPLPDDELQSYKNKRSYHMIFIFMILINLKMSHPH